MVKEVDMPDNESPSESSYTGPSYKDVYHMNREALVKYEKYRLRPLIDNGYENVLFAVFQEAGEHFMQNVHTRIYKVMGQADIKSFFCRGAQVLLDEKMTKLTKSQAFKQDIVVHFT